MLQLKNDVAAPAGQVEMTTADSEIGVKLILATETKPRRPPGRPPGALGRVIAPSRRLGVHLFAFLRAVQRLSADLQDSRGLASWGG
jgi:hypothetical protein